MESLPLFRGRKIEDPFQMKKIANSLLVGLISIVGILIMLGGLDRYIFSERISAVDPKALYYNVKSVIAQAHIESVGTAAPGNADAAEFGAYRVVFATDHLVILYTASFTSSAYLAFNRIGNSNAWAVGWLRGARFSQIGTFRF